MSSTRDSAIAVDADAAIAQAGSPAPRLIQCSFVMLSGEVIMTTRFRLDDCCISIGTLFFLARDVLWSHRPTQTMRATSATYQQIRLAIGPAVFSAKESGRAIFSVPEVAELVQAGEELRVTVIVTQEPDSDEYELVEV